jgi:uncharacterized protein (TIGR03437 family)
MSVNRLLTFAAIASASLFGQASILSCQASANPPVVRAEGITERTGDINLNCFGGQPNAVITGNLNIFLNVAITNRIRNDGTADAILQIDNGGGFVPVNVPVRPSAQSSLTWAGVTIPLSNEGKVNLRIRNVRAAAAQLNPNSYASIVATLTFNAGALVSFLTNGFVVGTVQRGLFTTSTSQLVCSFAGSPSPEGVGLTGAVSQRTFFSTVRVTEGFPSAFAPLPDLSNQNADSGTRIIVRYYGIPGGARIFTPRFIAGSDALSPTSAGDFGYPVNGGQYQSGRGSLLMVRVSSPDGNGGSGTASALPIGEGYINVFEELSEVTYTGDGNAFAIYEVLDAEPTRLQSALIPSFLELLPLAVDRNTTIRQDVLLASLSSLSELRTGASTHLPRFVSTVVPQSDCPLLGDCRAVYFPRLAVNANAIEVSTDNAKPTEYRYLYVSNSGSGNLLWNASMRYISGGNSQWLRISPLAGINNETIQLNLSPAGLTPGTYVAEVIVDGGQITGQWTVKVTMRVGVGPPPTPVIQSVTNAAHKFPGPLVAGSLAAISGTRFTGRKIEVYFNSMAGRIISDNPEEIIVQVPIELKDLPNANVTVISDGVSSAPYYAYFANSAPAIFTNYILNEDFSINAEFNPVLAGTLLHIFGTGMPLSGVYTARIHDRDVPNPEYAGVAPGLIGIQQVTILVPADLPTMTTDARICGGPSRDDQTCSGPRPVTIREVPQQQ